MAGNVPLPHVLKIRSGVSHRMSQIPQKKRTIDFVLIILGSRTWVIRMGY